MRKSIAAKGPQERKVAIALQGSFGHETYALGIMAGLQREKIPFHAASGCVATMLPLWLYFNKPGVLIENYFANSGSPVHPILSFAALDGATWSQYLIGLQRDILASLAAPADYGRQRKLLGNLLGYAGGVVFNRAYFEGQGDKFETLMREVSVPVFTNALNAQNFNEVYLYSGPLTAEQLDTVRGGKWLLGRREVARMDLDRFIASGARAPLLAPIRVRLCEDEIAPRFRGQKDPEQHATQYWMEGAMRCNPPLNPLFDVGATDILLVRLFARSKLQGNVENEAALLDRYLETIFTAPLEKEIATIRAISALRCNDEVRILDPSEPPEPSDSSEPSDPSKEVASLHELVSVELDYLSHFDIFNVLKPEQPELMFERGMTIGKDIAEWLLKKLADKA